MKRSFMVAAIFGGLVLAGCAVGPDYKRPETNVPGGWSATPPATQPATQLTAWWRTFQDPTLDQLIATAADGNLDLQIALSRVREARALRRAAVGGFFPSLNGSGRYTRTRFSENGSAIGNIAGAAGGIPGLSGFSIEPEFDTYQVGFDASWELDIFGRVRRSAEAAGADVDAAVESHRDVVVSLLAEVARNYYDYRGFQKRIAVARKNLASQQEVLDVTRTRFEKGVRTDLDLARTEVQVELTRAAIPLLQLGQRQAQNRLAVLLGRWPGQMSELLGGAGELPARAVDIPAGLPSELLLRRPDIRRAERELASATARVGVATADLYPRLSLTGSLGLQSQDSNTLVESASRFWSVGPALTLPIFQGGRLRANLSASQERQKQTFLRYQQTVLGALQEVEDALATHELERERHTSLMVAVTASARAVKRVQEQDRQGTVDYLTVLDAQRSLLLAEDQLAVSERNLAASAVAIYKALGGGWEP